MQLFKFGREEAKAVMNYDSISTLYSKILKTHVPTNIGLMYVEKNGLIGRHEAPVPQLFIVIEGEGWVQGESEEKVEIKTGEAVLWNKGESHVCGSSMGITAIVIQPEEIFF